MGKRTSYEQGVFSYVELLTPDAERAKAFYAKAFGWEADEVPLPEGGAYTLFRVQGDVVAGMHQPPQEQFDAGVPPHWLSYVTVDDADATAERVTELGGHIHAGPFDVMEEGRMAVVGDPAGAMFGVWQARNSIGSYRVNDPGCMTMNELSTNDIAGSREFYSSLFGWEFEEQDTGDAPAYWSIRHEGAARGLNGGMRELAPEQAEQGIPPHWMPYFTTASLDETLETGGGEGANTLFGPIEIPAGKIAVVADPPGAVFGLFEGEVDD